MKSVNVCTPNIQLKTNKSLCFTQFEGSLQNYYCFRSKIRTDFVKNNKWRLPFYEKSEMISNRNSNQSKLPGMMHGMLVKQMNLFFKI